MSYRDIAATFRPIDAWPGKPTAYRKRAPFDASWTATMQLLQRELKMLGAKKVVVQIDMRESDIRQDGYPRANATAKSPGVILALESKYGPLRYPCDTFNRWEDNVRAIALALEALRKVDRYGVTKRGEQYTGWKALPPTATPDLATRGHELIQKHGGVREALFATHPDRGGSADDFRAVQAARAG